MARICPRCQINELPPRYRVCDDCLVRKPTQPGEPPGPSVLPRTIFTDDVVLDCGHIVASRAAAGSKLRCPLHRSDATVLRPHDGVEVPEIQPMRRRR